MKTQLLSFTFLSLLVSINPAAAKDIPDYFDLEPTDDILKSVSNAMGGLTPSDVGKTENALDRYEEAKQQQKKVTPISEPYVLKLHTKRIKEVLISRGYQSEIVFFDLNGNPWEVANVSTGNTELIEAKKDTVLTHVVTVSTKSEQFTGRTNIKVRFKGLDTSVSFPIHINTEAYHDALNVTLPGKSPNSKDSNISIYKQRAVLYDPVARSILDNPVNPDGGSNCQHRNAIVKSITGEFVYGVEPVVFSCSGAIYIRSQFLSSPSPDPNGIILGADDYKVFKYIDQIDFFTFRSQEGKSLFVEVVKPKNQIGARFGDQVKLK